MFSHYVRNFGLLISVLTTSQFIIAQNDDLIKNICAKNIFPSFCKDTLRKRYLPGMAYHDAYNTKQQIKFKIGFTKESHLLESLDVCKDKFKIATSNMSKGKGEWHEKKYVEIRVLASETIVEVKKCKYEVQIGEFPLEKDIFRLKMLLLNVESVCDYAQAEFNSEENLNSSENPN